MKPQKLKMCGIGPYANEIPTIDFEKFEEKGLFLISGDTGAGKTTIFDGICYALFDSTSGSYRSTKNLRSEYADPSTVSYVDFYFTHQNKEYRVYRQPEYERKSLRGSGTTRESEKAVLYENGIAIKEGIKPVNTYIKELLSVDVDQFKQIAMIAQGEFYALLNASTKDRTEILRSIFVTNAYNNIEFKLNDKMKKAADEKQALERSIIQYFMQVKSDTDSLLELQEKAKEKSSIWNYEEMENAIKEVVSRDERSIKPLSDELSQAEEDEKKSHVEYENADRLNKKIARRDELKNKKEELDNKKEEILKREENLKKEKEATRFINPSYQLHLDKKKKFDSVTEDIKKNKSEKEEAVKRQEAANEALSEIESLKAEVQRLTIEIENIKLDKPKYEDKDRLEKSYKRAQNDYEDARDRYEKVHLQKDETERILNDNRAGLLASNLKEGEACPVCGSTSHPHLASLVDCSVTQEDLEALKIEENDTLKERDELIIKTQELKAQLDQISKLAFNNWNEAKKHLEIITSGKVEMEEKISSAEKEKKEADEQVAAINRASDILAKTKKEAEEELEEAKENLSKLLEKYGYSSEDEMLMFVKDEAYLEKADKEIEAYNRDVQVNKVALQEIEAEVKDKEIVNLSALKDALDEKVSQTEELRNQKNEILNRKESNEDLLRKMDAQKNQFEKASHEHSTYTRLYNLVKGKSGNGSKITLEQYIQAAGFDGIIQAANRRLSPMSDGQYELFRQENSSDNRSNTFLDLEVLDNYTGRRRPVGSLSGGESFKASLALALGLSDTVSSNLGGVQMDALFIDEGFGTLDRKSIDSAMETLVSLSGANKLVGIISHREELMDNILQQIRVTKTTQGSHIEVVSE